MVKWHQPEQERDMRATGPRLLNVRDAAKCLGISPNTLRAWSDKGLIATVRLPNGYRRYQTSVIERARRDMGFLEEHSE